MDCLYQFVTCCLNIFYRFLSGMAAGLFCMGFFSPHTYACHHTLSGQNVSGADSRVCINGWLPPSDAPESQCLRISACMETDKTTLPSITHSQCPLELSSGQLTKNNFQAVMQVNSENQTYREFIHSDNYSSAWLPSSGTVWSGINGFMLGLHLWKVMDKVQKFYQGKVSARNILFFTSYLLGAAWHLVDMPVLFASEMIPALAHYASHAVMLPLSILARKFDCSCCGQVKNGHNIMLAFNSAALIFIYIRYAYF